MTASSHRSRSTGIRSTLTGVLLTALLSAPAMATPALVEAGWSLARTDSFSDAQAARFHPFDGRLYLVRLKPDTLGGGLYRIEENGSATLISTAYRPTGVAIDPFDGAIFHSETQSGLIFRTAFGATGRQTWVSGFHSGDDDPMGIDIAPAHHSGPLLLPREGLMADEGTNGPKEIWRFDAAVAEGETVVHADDGSLQKPVDVTIGAADVYVADQIGGAVLRVESDGSVTPIVTTPPIAAPMSVVEDPRSAEILVMDTGNDEVVRVDPLTGVLSVVMTGLVLTPATDQSGLDFTPDGVELIVTDRTANEVYTYSRLPATSTASPLTCGETLLPTFASLGETGLYRFNAGAGDVVGVTSAVRNASGAFPHAVLFAPDGTRVSLGDVYGGCYGVCPSEPLPADGAYRVVLFEDGHDAIGDASLSLASLSGGIGGGGNGRAPNYCNSGDGTTFLSCGTPATGTLAVEGDADPLTFLASAGETVRVTLAPSLGSIAQPQALLYEPGGTQLQLNGSTAPCTGICDSASLTQSGTYTLLVFDALLTATGDYDVQVDDLVLGVPACESHCSDGVDNDGDLAVDLADAGCEGADDFSEEPACNDGVDNDGDGLVDLADLGCAQASSSREDPQCDDGLDNDGDGLADWDGAGFGGPDPNCVFASSAKEKPSSPSCGLGPELAVLVPLLGAVRRRALRSRGRS